MRLIIASVLALAAVVISLPQQRLNAQAVTQADRDYALALLEGIDRAWPILNEMYQNPAQYQITAIPTGNVAQFSMKRAITALFEPIDRYQSHVSHAMLEHDVRIRTAADKTLNNWTNGPWCFPPASANPATCLSEAMQRQQARYYVQWFKNVLEIEARELRQFR